MDDLSVSLVVRAILDGQGFEDARANLRALAADADKAASPLRHAGEQARVAGERLGGARGPVADLARAMLIEAGAAHGAGEAAKFLGVGLTALEAGAVGASLGVVALTAGVAFLLPRMLEWWQQGEKVSEKTRSVVDGCIDLGHQVADLIRDVPALADKYKNLAGALHELAMQQERLQSQDVGKAMDELREQIDALKPTAGAWLSILKLTRPEAMAWAQATAEDSQEVKDLKAQLLALSEAMDLHRRAAEQGLTIEELLAKERREGVKATKEQADAEQAAAEFQVQMDAIRVRQSQERLEAVAAAQDYALQQEKDARADMERETRKMYGTQKENLLKEQAYQNAYAGLKRREQEIDKATALNKRMLQDEQISYVGQTLGALSSIFGKNKALAVAGAIADTYAAADRAFYLAGGYPLGVAAMVATIAQGIANVKAIMDAKPGFDDPFSDSVARMLGRGSAVDFVHHFAGEFIPSVRAGMRGAMAGSGVINNYRVDRSTHYGGVSVSGFIGAGRQEFVKGFDRWMNEAERMRGRTTLGRPGS